MSNLHTCTSTTRPTNPNQGDMLFETDSDQLILYYNGAWLTFGASAQAASTVLSIDIGVGVESDITTYFDTRYTGDWFVNTSRTTNSPMCIKYNKGVYKYATPDFDVSFNTFEQQLVPGKVEVGIATVGVLELTIDDVSNNMAMTPRGDIMVPNHAKNQYTTLFVKSPTPKQPEHSVASSNNMVMQSDTSSVTLNATYPAGTLVVTQYNQAETHVGFASESDFYSTKDIPTGVLHVDKSKYADLTGPKSFVSKIYRDTQNSPVSAGPQTYVHGAIENDQNNHAVTMWFKLSATDPGIEIGKERFLFGLGGHSALRALSASDGSGWYLNSDSYFADQIPQNEHTKLEEDEWYNVTVAISGEPENLPSTTNRDARVYLNGDLVHTSNTARGSYYRHIGTDHETNASSSGENQDCLNGNWTGFAIWKTVLTESQISIIANNTNILDYYPQIPEPVSYYHPVCDPIRLFGAYDKMRNSVSNYTLFNQEPIKQGSTTTGVDARSTYQYDYYLVDRDGYEIFSQDATIYSEDHPSK